MSSIDIVIPTIGRQEKLTNCLNSVFHSCKDLKDVNIYLYFSIREEFEYFSEIFKDKNLPLICVLINSYRAPDFWNNHLKSMTSDLLVYINDDVLLYTDTIEKIIDKFDIEISDLDGVLGLSQANIPIEQAVQGAFGVIGRKFADRFPDRKVFSPDYDRFYIDLELMQYAKSQNKFFFDKEIKIQHLHPLFGGKEDQTHKEVRRYLSKDRETHRQRVINNWLWGREFNLINQ